MRRLVLYLAQKQDACKLQCGHQSLLWLVVKSYKHMQLQVDQCTQTEIVDIIQYSNFQAISFFLPLVFHRGLHLLLQVSSAKMT